MTCNDIKKLYIVIIFGMDHFKPKAEELKL